MPPQARSKRPSSRRFIAGGQGEWSVTTRSMDAVAQALPQRFAVAATADRRGAFEQGGAVGDFFGGEVEIVRAGLDGDGQAFSARGLQLAQGLRGGEVDDVQAESNIAGRGGSSGGWLRVRPRRGARRGRWRSCASRRRAGSR